MEARFGILDAVTFVVFAVLIAVAVILVVSLGQLPGRLARKWGHPHAAAINVASWLVLATGGLLWTLALIWAFLVPPAAEPARRSAASFFSISLLSDFPPVAERPAVSS